jgi:sulfatase maturation enzyme AslB (radical SAM superfamily)
MYSRTSSALVDFSIMSTNAIRVTALRVDSKLKTTMRRTDVCRYCDKHKPAKQIKECSGCKITRYCSRECQLAHYPEHKSMCTLMQVLSEME